MSSAIVNVMISKAIILVLAALAAGAASAQRPNTNYDEAKAGTYTLPDPLILRNGKRVSSAADWNRLRRPEILEMFRGHVYGRSPGRPERMTFELASVDRQALDGKAVRKEITVYFAGTKTGPQMTILLYLPAGATRPSPVFAGLNFTGNHEVNPDPGIRLAEVWTRDPATKAVTHKRAAESTRGAARNRWQVEKILEHGYGLATIYYGDISPDFPGNLQNGVHSMYWEQGQSKPARDDEWGAIGAWAWGLSRALDYLETDKDVDARRVAVMGHSRLGKTALWAGAEDTRFALVISNDSGEGGAALSRRNFGETITDLNRSFPHWFCTNYKQFSGRADELPVDHHELIALIAPRPVYVASAEQDQWADPRGEFLSAANAGPVYKLLGKEGLGTDRMPDVHQPIMHTVGYHIRAGKHDVTAYDWDQYLKFAEMHLGK